MGVQCSHSHSSWSPALLLSHGIGIDTTGRLRNGDILIHYGYWDKRGLLLNYKENNRWYEGVLNIMRIQLLNITEYSKCYDYNFLLQVVKWYSFLQHRSTSPQQIFWKGKLSPWHCRSESRIRKISGKPGWVNLIQLFSLLSVSIS